MKTIRNITEAETETIRMPRPESATTRAHLSTPGNALEPLKGRAPDPTTPEQDR